MSLRDEVLRDFRASFDRLQTVRACDDTEPEGQELRHAQRNFDAAAESLARLVPNSSTVRTKSARAARNLRLRRRQRR